MRIQSLISLTLGVILTVGLTSCSPNRHATKGPNGSYADPSHTIGSNYKFYGTEISKRDERELLSKKTYYFSYDNFRVEDEDILAIYAHAKTLLSKKSAHIRLDGHTDERGSSEYNIALGEKRAKAVANVLMLKGVSPEQITIVSYGKAKPAVSGHYENDWQLNRRVEIVYES